jgi:hypothetical protein
MHLSEGEVYLFDAFTERRHRGRGFAPALCLHQLRYRMNLMRTRPEWIDQMFARLPLATEHTVKHCASYLLPFNPVRITDGFSAWRPCTARTPGPPATCTKRATDSGSGVCAR